VTLRRLDAEDQIAILVAHRDWCSDEAFYYRRRAADHHDRQHAIDLENASRELDGLIGNLRRDRAVPPAPGVR